MKLTVAGDGPLREPRARGARVRAARRAGAAVRAGCRGGRAVAPRGLRRRLRRGDGPRPAGGGERGRRAARPGRRRRDRAARAAARRRRACAPRSSGCSATPSCAAGWARPAASASGSTSPGRRSPTRRSRPTRTRLPAERPAVVLGLLWAGLSFARSLGRRGVPVTGITMHPHEFGTRSRYLRDVSRARGDEAVLKALRAHAQGDVKPVLLPERDDHVELVLRHWDELSELVRAADARRPGRRAPAAAQGDAAAGGRARGRRRAAHGRGGLDRDAAQRSTCARRSCSSRSRASTSPARSARR